MSVTEIRDPEEVRTFVTQALWMQRVLPPAGPTVQPALEWSLEILAGGHPLPPPGFVADLGHVALDMDWDQRSGKQRLHLPSLPPQLLPTYEDHVLGKIYADWSFSAAAEALRKYREGRDRSRGLAFLANQLRQRAGFPGVEFSPGILHSLLDQNPDELLRQGFDSLEHGGPHPLLVSLYEWLIASVRRVPEVLSAEDVLELQMGTALDEEGDRMALRQVLEATTLLENGLPRHRVRPLPRREEVPTRVLDEDTYPVGGFSSLSNRGSIESLLHSQLAFMEDEGSRPDLFEIKYLRDELLYYSRDENQFLRRRRTFVMAFFPDLAERLRFKDANLPYQRGVLLLAMLLVVVRRLSEWLSTDALVFNFVFLVPVTAPASFGLQTEFELLCRLLREQVANHTVIFDVVFVLPESSKGESSHDTEQLRRQLQPFVPHGTLHFSHTRSSDALGDLCTLRSRRSLCHCLALSTRPQAVDAEDTVVTRCLVDGPRPALGGGNETPAVPEGEDDLDTWHAALRQLLQRWI